MNDLPKPTVLVVDDTETNVDILVEALSNEYEVSVAIDGESALDIIESEPPDLVLLDIMMPGMDGYEVCSRLKANVRTKEIPVIFLTAKSEASDETKGLELGAVDYITKPISLPIVRARIKTHLSLLSARRKLEEQNEELREAARLREDVELMTRHDLKNPLNTIINVPQILIRRSDHPDQLKLLKMVENSGHKMLGMINLSLDLFKMERGLYKFMPMDMDLLKVVHDIISGTQNILSSKKLSVIISVNGRPAEKTDSFPIKAEELLCYSMLSNLFKNAQEASPKGETIAITLEKKDVSSISIHNVGEVPESIRENFFEKYVTSGKSDGTGLGTYSAKLIAETQGGSIQLETSDGKGSTVTVKFAN